MSTFAEIMPTQKLDPFKGVKKVPCEEYFTSGHRTCEGCESAQFIRLLAKAAGDRKSTRLNSSHPSKSRMPSSA